MTLPKTTRMAAQDRRELILDAATRAFAKGGYTGTTTDQIALEAEVSQPYVVRMFGSKNQLFHEVFVRAISAIKSAFTDVLDADGGGTTTQELIEELGAAYIELLRDHDLLMVMMHGFVQGPADAELAAKARTAMSEIYALIRERTGCTPVEAREFIAHGMLLNVLTAMQAPEHGSEDPALAELVACAMGPGAPESGR